MGSGWEEHPTEGGQRERAPFGSSRAPVGLEAEELDLLRSAPDFDAEEMASVRPLGGWPDSLPVAKLPESVPVAELTEAPPPAWRPPNRIEPPARSVFPPAEPAAAPTAPVPATPAAPPAGTRFPEERTMALMAQDLLGRPLDEPEPAVLIAPPAKPARPAWSAAAGGTDIWDSAMPLQVEG